VTSIEFKAWFAGFTDGFAGPPDEKRWERVKERVAQIDEAPATQYTFHNYLPYRQVQHTQPIYRGPYPVQWPTFLAGSADVVVATSAQNAVAGAASGLAHVPPTDEPWDGLSAMYDLGKADALSFGGTDG